MLPRENRFTQKNFEIMRKRMKGFNVQNFLFLYGEDKSESHFAVVISKKVEKSAVKRNRFRRQVYENIRKNLLPNFEKFNVICLYKGSSIPQNAGEIKKAIQTFSEFARKKVFPKIHTANKALNPQL